MTRGEVESHWVRCPYCGETVEMLVASDLRGELVEDCEVCCNPWRVRIQAEADGLRVEIGSLDD